MLRQEDTRTLIITSLYGLIVTTVVLLLIMESHANIIRGIVEDLEERSTQEIKTIKEAYYYDREDPLYSLVPYHSALTDQTTRVSDIEVRAAYILGFHGKILLSVSKVSKSADGTESLGWGPLNIEIDYIDGSWEITGVEEPI